MSLFEEVVSKHPATLYATWAQLRLGKQPRARSVPFEGDLEQGFRELRRDSRFATAVELLRLQMRGARPMLTSVSLEGKSDDAVHAFVTLMGDLGFEDAFSSMPERTLRAILYGPLNSNTESVFRAHRPRTMEMLLGGESARTGVELSLIQGIVHRESGFNPKAQSPVGAIGLMQIMPDTAKFLARKLSAPVPSLQELRQANINARFGAFYLGDLIRRFEGRVELAVAAYNAGPGRVQRWWREGAFTDVDEFVENIPIKETRNYVKDVLGDRAAYRLLRYRPAVSSARTSRHGG